MNLNKIIIYIKNPFIWIKTRYINLWLKIVIKIKRKLPVKKLILLPLLSTLAFADYTYYKRRLKAYTIIQNL